MKNDKHDISFVGVSDIFFKLTVLLLLYVTGRIDVNTVWTH